MTAPTALTTYTDLQLLRASAGLPLHGELNIPRLQADIARCCGGDLASCNSCAAMAEVIAAECSPEDRDFEPGRFYRNG